MSFFLRRQPTGNSDKSHNHVILLKKL